MAQKILSDEYYAITSIADKGQKGVEINTLINAFKQAAKKEGIRISTGAVWGDGNVAEISVEENVPFTTMQSIINRVSSVTEQSVFLSSDTDGLGKKVMDYSEKEASDVVRREVILGKEGPGWKC